MKTHIWLSLRGRLLWGVMAWSILGLISLWLEVARGFGALWTWLEVGDLVDRADPSGGWTFPGLTASAMAISFFFLAVVVRRSFDQSVVVDGSPRSGIHLFFRLGRAQLVFWSAILLSCAGCLVAETLRLSALVLDWLGVGWLGWSTLCGLHLCIAFSSRLSLRGLGQQVGVDTIRSGVRLGCRKSAGRVTAHDR